MFTGITEAFVHAVLDPSGLSAANAMLVVFAVAHVISSAVMVKLGGAAGLVLADAFTMLLRIAYSVRYVRLRKATHLQRQTVIACVLDVLVESYASGDHCHCSGSLYAVA